ncbi:hypothetical protein [Legionella hackeliae]|uniref:Uncharacterized protein n=1 Tax=Legionella hackeliae TaxID=449 RepID=A0A0A8UT66_LEGHA|nr:hypothetical protein [Legionella hackeliae]KTD11481.1 hypothetical protein Lhac_1877 [Legionella hackeliae]CEK10686.1 protein of unknown function [Legionella hackeliae]STX47433.1 Uncharacterised protein [Legionella hackeliae]
MSWQYKPYTELPASTQKTIVQKYKQKLQDKSTPTFFQSSQTTIDNAQTSIPEGSCLTPEQYTRIVTLRGQLTKEIKSRWPYPNKDRKEVKVDALNKLIDLSITNNLLETITMVEDQFRLKGVFSGVISMRTSDLFDDLRKTCAGVILGLSNE